MNKRHISITILQQHKKEPQQLKSLRYDERLLPSTRSIYAPCPFEQHQDKIGQVESRYASNRTIPDRTHDDNKQKRKKNITKTRSRNSRRRWTKPVTTTKSTHTKKMRGQLQQHFTDDDLKHKYIFHLCIITHHIYLSLIN